MKVPCMGFIVFYPIQFPIISKSLIDIVITLQVIHDLVQPAATHVHT